MKAKEYYNKYQSAIGNHAPAAIQLQMLHDFRDEFWQTCRDRKISRPDSRLALARQFNDKWNAVRRMYLDNDGVAILEESAFAKSYAKGDERTTKEVSSQKATRLPTWPTTVRTTYIERCGSRADGLARNTQAQQSPEAHREPSFGIDIHHPNALVTLAMLGHMIQTGQPYMK